MSESVTTATESSSDYQCAGQQLPQLSEFNDPQWIETMMQTSEDVLVAPTTLLLYVVFLRFHNNNKSNHD